MTDEAAAYRAMVFTGLAKLDELLSAEQLHSDLIRIRAYVDHLLGEDVDERGIECRTRTTTIRTSSAQPMAET